MGMLFVFIPRVSLRLPWAMCLLGLQPTLPKSETLVNYIANIHEKSDKNKFCVIFIIGEALVNIKVTKMK